MGLVGLREGRVKYEKTSPLVLSPLIPLTPFSSLAAVKPRLTVGLGREKEGETSTFLTQTPADPPPSQPEISGSAALLRARVGTMLVVGYCTTATWDCGMLRYACVRVMGFHLVALF